MLAAKLVLPCPFFFIMHTKGLKQGFVEDNSEPVQCSMVFSLL